MNLEEERDSLRRELRGVQEMLAHVLLALEAPVMVLKESLEKGIPEGVQIRIDDDQEKNAFIFYLDTPDD